jgi:L-amino acid N-acyltransferase YncA
VGVADVATTTAAGRLPCGLQMLIRHGDPASDAAGCAAVYAPFVDGSPVSFEESPPSALEYSKRIERLNRTHAFLVADDDGRVAGFAYAGPHRERPAYRWSCESTVYLDPSYHRKGLGRALYTVLFDLLERQGYVTVLAGITVPNDASVGLHEACGFTMIGAFPRIGWKAGSWRNVAWMSRHLGLETEDEREPASPGAPVRLSAPIELPAR